MLVVMSVTTLHVARLVLKSHVAKGMQSRPWDTQLASTAIDVTLP